MTIQNKTVLITGANRGIGRALVNEALRRGATRIYAGTRGASDFADPRVTPVMLDVTNTAQIEQAASEVSSLDVLINNAGIALYDDLSNIDVIEQILAVNLFGSLKMSRAFLPALKRSKGAIVNTLSLMALAPLPLTPAYGISKAAAFNMTQSLRALLAGQGVTVHGVLLGPTDTDMTRGFEIPKASPEEVAQGIFDGLENNEEDIFPDPASQSIAEDWRTGVAKAFERQYAGFVPHEVAPQYHASPIGGRAMKTFTTTISVDQTPNDVFAAINNVRGWWSGEIESATDKLGAEFTYRYKDAHRSTQKITEFIPSKKVAWHVSDSYLNFVKDKSEWTGTDIVFDISTKDGKTEIRFTHSGLAPEIECYGSCSNAWGVLIGGNLRKLISTGKSQPDVFA